MPKSSATLMPKSGAAKKATAAGGIGKPVTPSKALAAIVGHHPLPRSEVVAKLWAYIKTHKLQDAADKRTIVADDKLRAVFGQDRATMFEMNKLVSAHLS